MLMTVCFLTTWIWNVGSGLHTWIVAQSNPRSALEVAFSLAFADGDLEDLRVVAARYVLVCFSSPWMTRWISSSVISVTCSGWFLSVVWMSLRRVGSDGWESRSACWRAYSFVWISRLSCVMMLWVVLGGRLIGSHKAVLRSQGEEQNSCGANPHYLSIFRFKIVSPVLVPLLELLWECHL